MKYTLEDAKEALKTLHDLMKSKDFSPRNAEHTFQTLTNGIGGLVTWAAEAEERLLALEEANGTR